MSLSTAPLTTTQTTTAIRHRVGIDAPQDQVQRALATVEGLAAWWTRDTTGDATTGGTLDFRFGDGPDRRIAFVVVEASPDLVEWRGLPEGPDEWVDTTVTFELAHENGETVIMFTHGGWREPVPFQAHCSMKWAAYLLSLKTLLEDGEGAPYPRDLHVSGWD